jgi:chorismate mutase
MDLLSLKLIAARLEGLEETIINKLVDRAQFKVNSAVYEPGRSGFTGEPEKSLFELRLLYQEEMDARFGRFSVPEERPFTTGLPGPRRMVNLPGSGLYCRNFDLVNVGAEIRSSYVGLVPAICPPGDDSQYGSSVEHDVIALQAISRRIHYGALYVAESKYREDPDGYKRLLADGDMKGVLEKLTRKSVEEKILERVREKVEHIQARINTEVRTCIDSGAVLRYYRDSIIPLTKKGEVLYLQNRME